MSSVQTDRRLAAVMFTDIIGYTALMQADEQKAAAQRNLHRQVFEEAHQNYQGEILQYFGDGTLSIFKSGVEAVACAIAIQQKLNTADGIPLRIGLHMGDIVFDGTEIYGDGVNVASRIESMGVAGGVLISGKLNSEMSNQQDIGTSSLGFFRLKNITDPLEVFSVTNAGLTVPQRHELGGKRVSDQYTIAVLPFINRSPDQQAEYLSDGMTEEIINALSTIDPLKVTSRTSSFFYKNKNLPLPQIGRELQVKYILEGSVQLVSETIRISATLVDAREDIPLWSETLTRKLDDIFAVQDEMSLLVAEKLREHIGHFDIADQLVPKPSIDVDDYNRYLKARYQILKMSHADIDEGLEMLESIIDRSPGFALAHLGIHLGYTLLGMLGFMPVFDAFTKGRPYLDKAIALDDKLPEVQLNLAYRSFLEDWDMPQTYKHLNLSFELRPTVEYYQSMSSALVTEGKLKAAHHYIDMAVQIDPFSPINYNLKGFLYFVEEQYERAIEQYEKSLELKPDSQVSIPEIGQSYILMGEAEKALDFYQNLSLADNDLLKLGGITMAYEVIDPERARMGIRTLEKELDGPQLDRALNALLMCQTLLGNTEKALDLLERCIQMRLPMMVYTQISPILKPLRGLERFQKLSEQIFGSYPLVDIPKRKYKKSLFNAEELTIQQQKLSRYMEQEEPYLDAGLSLRDLAAKLDMPSNYLSQLLNEGFGQNFSEFVNGYRLADFKSKVVDRQYSHLTLLGLAYESGFNSKTVFNTYFKKAEGVTPAAYRKKMMQE
ncbi:MAG: helix-turn-helix domain-containing protein [Bacteroidota bacterium]